MMLMLLCLPFSLTLIVLLFTGFHSINDFSSPFFRMIATPSKCMLLSLPEYKTVSPVPVLCLPAPVHLLSLTPKICRLYLFISDVTCAYLPDPNIFLTFQKPSLVCFFSVKDFHRPASGFLSALTTDIHTSVQGTL